MKILAPLVVLTTAILTSAEFPSPYFSKNYPINRPQPQTVYGPPSQSLQLPNLKIQTSPFRPFSPRPVPFTTYGAPPQGPNTPSISSNGAFGTFQSSQVVSPNSWQIIKSPQTLYGAPQRETENFPKTSYGAPPKLTGHLFSRPNSPQITYGAPPEKNAPQTTYGAPQRQNRPILFQNSQKVTSPQTTYGAPSKQIGPTWQLSNGLNSPQVSYGTPQKQIRNNNFGQDQQLDFRNLQPNSPQTQYGAPDVNSVETLERLKALTSIASQSLPLRQPGIFKAQSAQQELPRQYLPVKNAVDFRKGLEWNHQNLVGNNLDLPRESTIAPSRPLPNLVTTNVEVQKLDIRALYPPLGATEQGADLRVPKTGEASQSNGQVRELSGKSVDYLPLTTTAVPVLVRPTKSTPSPATTPQPEEEKTETTVDPATSGGQPNVAIATAVAGVGVGGARDGDVATPGEQQFYLLQPDGRLQKVVYQKTQQEGDADNEYTVDYRFHNIQSDPNYVYAPLVTLG